MKCNDNNSVVVEFYNVKSILRFTKLMTEHIKLHLVFATV
jgi:hypothetical protein